MSNLDEGNDSLYWCSECCDSDLTHKCKNCGADFCTVCAQSKEFLCSCGGKIVTDDEYGIEKL